MLSNLTSQRFTPDGEPLRPMSAYFLFANTNKGMIGYKHIPKAWQEMGYEQKLIYERYATAAKDEYQVACARRSRILS